MTRQNMCVRGGSVTRGFFQLVDNDSQTSEKEKSNL